MATSARDTGTSPASASKKRHAASLSMARTSSSRFLTQLFEPGKGGKSCAAKYRNQKEKTVRKDRVYGHQGNPRGPRGGLQTTDESMRSRRVFRSECKGQRRRANCGARRWRNRF